MSKKGQSRDNLLEFDEEPEKDIEHKMSKRPKPRPRTGVLRQTQGWGLSEGLAPSKKGAHDRGDGRDEVKPVNLSNFSAFQSSPEKVQSQRSKGHENRAFLAEEEVHEIKRQHKPRKSIFDRDDSSEDESRSTQGRSKVIQAEADVHHFGGGDSKASDEDSQEKEPSKGSESIEKSEKPEDYLAIEMGVDETKPEEEEEEAEDKSKNTSEDATEEGSKRDSKEQKKSLKDRWKSAKSLFQPKLVRKRPGKVHKPSPEPSEDLSDPKATIKDDKDSSDEESSKSEADTSKKPTLSSSESSTDSEEEEKVSKNVKREHTVIDIGGGDHSSSSSEESEPVREVPEVRKVKKLQKYRKSPNTPPGNKRNFLGVTIYSADLLPRDPYIVHPLVKLTPMDQSGKFLKSSKYFGDHTARKRQRGFKSRATDSKIEGIQPVMTSAAPPSFWPNWNELIAFEEDFDSFFETSDSPIFFFEVMDCLRMKEKRHFYSRNESHGSEEGWYKIAWAFLKPIGANGERNTDRKLRLQLYKPEVVKDKSKDDLPEVFSWWNSGKKIKIPQATLTVEVKGISPPEELMSQTDLRSLLSLQSGELNKAVIESQFPASKKGKKTGKARKTEKGEEKVSETEMESIRRKFEWRRIPGQNCKIPNTLLMSLPASPLPNVHLSICGNVHGLVFSPDGQRLACGLDNEELHLVLIFEFPSGALLQSLRGHYDLIYELDWSELNSRDSLMATASADTTSNIWLFSRSNSSEFTPPKLIKTLLHPAFVYAVKFHPTEESLIVTGCFDHAIRIWDIFRKGPSQSVVTGFDFKDDSMPILMLDKHSSFINALAFTPNGEYLFSGDGQGLVAKWKTSRSPKKKIWALEKAINLSESGHSPVNSLSVDPARGHRLIVHLRESRIKVIDVSTMLVLQVLTGFVNDRLHLRSTFSPCGNLILSGSEDGTLWIWAADTGAALKFISPRKNGDFSVTSVDFHPLDHFFAMGLTSPYYEPSPIIVYDHQDESGQSFNAIRAKKHKTRRHKFRHIHSKPNADGKKPGSAESFQKIITKLDSALKATRTMRSKIITNDGGISGEEKHANTPEILEETPKNPVRIKITESTPPPEDVKRGLETVTIQKEIPEVDESLLTPPSNLSAQPEENEIGQNDIPVKLPPGNKRLKRRERQTDRV